MAKCPSGRLAVALAIAAVAVAVAAATMAHTQALIKNPATPPPAMQQCADCHILYPPQMLPQRSWAAILEQLADHFGDNATVPGAARSRIAAYLAANAADGPATTGRGKLYMSGLADDVTPARITVTPWWNQIHADYDFGGGKHIDRRVAPRCLTCHAKEAP